MKVTVFGGGSSYTPELVNGFLARAASFPITELWLVDISRERLDIVGGFAQRMVEAKGSPFAVHLTSNQQEAIDGAGYVTTQLRVGGMEARRNDEYLGRRYGLVGQETTGVGGMAKALRTIPVILSIARDMRNLAPEAMLVNFTNPAGLVTEALGRYVPEVPAAGVCNVPITAKMSIIDMLKRHQGLEIDPAQAELKTLGLNHLSWHRGFTVNGNDIWPQVIEALLQEIESTGETEWDAATIRALNLFPNYYLEYYYYTNRKIAHQQKWPPSRAEEVMEVEAELLQQYAEPDRVAPPENLMKRGGAYYSTVATQLLNAHYNNLGETHIVNVPHAGAVSGWPAGWVLEMPCRVDSSGIHPLAAAPLPPACFGLLAHVKSYEILTAQAAATGDKNAAYLALLAHPLGPPADKIEPLLDEMLQINRAWLPQF